MFDYTGISASRKSIVAPDQGIRRARRVAPSRGDDPASSCPVGSLIPRMLTQERAGFASALPVGSVVTPCSFQVFQAKTRVL